MAYTWTNGELITADKLNNTGGALICEATFDGADYVLDKTVQEIYDALLAGMPAYIKFQYGQIDQDYLGTIYLAPIIKIYNYNYTNVIRICASNMTEIGTKGNIEYCFSPTVLIFKAADIDDYPIFLTTIYTGNSYVSAGGIVG